MTCVSLRSGIASSGTVFIDQTPATAATATSRNTRKRCFAENSMMALIMAIRSRRPRRLPLGHRHRRRHRLCRRGAAVLVLGGAHAARGGLQLTLGIDQERAGRDDPLTGSEAARDRHAIAKPVADDNLTG